MTHAEFHLGNLRRGLVREEEEVTAMESAIAIAPAETSASRLVNAHKELDRLRMVADKSREAIALWENKVA